MSDEMKQPVGPPDPPRKWWQKAVSAVAGAVCKLLGLGNAS
jgi:hypothetical protein